VRVMLVPKPNTWYIDSLHYLSPGKWVIVNCQIYDVLLPVPTLQYVQTYLMERKNCKD
jgi:hypothetical protein